MATIVSPRESVLYHNVILSSYIASSSKSFVTGQNNQMPSTLSLAESNRLSSILNLIATLLLLKTDLQIYIKNTTVSIVDPLHQKEKKLIKQINYTIVQIGEQIVIYYIVLLDRVFFSGDIVLQTNSLENMEQLIWQNI